LYGLYTGRATPDILDMYDRVRRKKYLEVIDKLSSDNLRRMFETDPDTVIESGSDELFNLCLKAEKDVELAKQLVTGINVIKYDFTQHYSEAGKI
jgi:hypothetical protein